MVPVQGEEVVWDRVVRSTHWLVAAFVVVDLTLVASGSRLHRWVGYAACVLVLFRVFWGFVGSIHARFSDWFPLPSFLFAYIKLLFKGREPRLLGHNPLGGVMMLFFWCLIVSLGVTGYLLGTESFFGDTYMEGLHRGMARVLYACVGLHIGAAVVTGWRHHENLVRSMITGRKAL